jgi:arginine repressor
MAKLKNPGADPYAGLPHIEPDPRLRVENWNLKEKNAVDAQFRVAIRRAFIQSLLANHRIRNIDEIQEAVRRRFGAKPGFHVIAGDLRAIVVVRVPVPGVGNYIRLASEYNKVNVEDELEERIRIDVLELRRKLDTIYLEVNRGTAPALTQLFNLIVDQGNRPGVVGITSDGDKWVAIHLEDGVVTTSWQEWLKQKLY